MSELYGVNRSNEYLAHYGIKGMKWGVKKAKESGNEKRLARQYKKAAKKLAKLNERTDIEKQSAKVNKYNKIAKVSGAIGGAALGTVGTLAISKDGNRLLTERAMKKAAQNHEAYRNALMANNHTAADNYYQLYSGQNERANQYWKHHMNASNALDAYAAPLGVTAAAGLGTAAIAKAKSYAAKKRTTSEGHAKAVAKRDAWKKEMKSAFKGTSYANLPPYAKKKVKHSDLEDPNSLAHYGIKGMKWGVQKAKSAHDSYALDKQYRKASAKLEKLNRKADATRNAELASKYGHRAVRGAADAALAGGLAALGHHNIKKATNTPYGQLDPGFAADLLSSVGEKGAANTLNAMRIGRQVAGATAAARAGMTAYNAARGTYHARKASVGGHAKAVAKRDQWQREMNEAFKGTRYASKSSNKKKRR